MGPPVCRWLVQQVCRLRLLLLLLQTGRVLQLLPVPLQRGLNVLLIEGAGGPRRPLRVRQRRDPLVRMAERVCTALQRILALQQALRVAVRSCMLHAAGLQVHG